MTGINNTLTNFEEGVYYELNRVELYNKYSLGVMEVTSSFTKFSFFHLSAKLSDGTFGFKDSYIENEYWPSLEDCLWVDGDYDWFKTSYEYLYSQFGTVFIPASNENINDINPVLINGTPTDSIPYPITMYKNSKHSNDTIIVSVYEYGRHADYIYTTKGQLLSAYYFDGDRGLGAEENDSGQLRGDLFEAEMYLTTSEELRNKYGIELEDFSKVDTDRMQTVKVRHYL